MTNKYKNKIKNMNFLSQPRATGIRSAGVCENKERRWSYANSRFNYFVSDYRHAAVKAYLGILTFNKLLFYRAK